MAVCGYKVTGHFALAYASQSMAKLAAAGIRIRYPRSSKNVFEAFVASCPSDYFKNDIEKLLLFWQI